MRFLLVMLTSSMRWWWWCWAADYENIRIDMEAASRGTSKLDEASHFELVQRVVALSKQNSKLKETDEWIKQSFLGAKLDEPSASSSAWPFSNLSSAARNREAITVASAQSRDDAELRALVRDLVVENRLARQAAAASQASLQGMLNAVSDESPEEDETTGQAKASNFKPPPADWTCDVLEIAGDGFEYPRLDGRAQPASMRDKWAAWLCPGQGITWLSKSRRYCDLGMKGSDVSLDESTVSELLSRGPDELYGTLHGAEAVSLFWTHDGNCSYVGRFEVARSGQYHLQLVHLREGYQGTTERRPVWPPMHYDFILGRRGLVVRLSEATRAAAEDEVPFCDSLDLSQASDRIQDGRYVYVGLDQRGDGSLNTESKSVVFGRGWLKKATEIATLARGWEEHPWDMDLVPPINVTRETIQGSIWWLLAVSPADYAWRPWTCRLRDVNAGSKVACLARHNSSVSGDSNSRAFVAGLVASACGDDKADSSVFCAKTQKGCTFLNAAKHCTTPPLRFQTSFYGDQGPPSGGYDVVVANFGQHPASGAHWSLARYRARVEEYFARHSNKSGYATKDRTRLIWASSPPVLRNDAWVMGNKDWRTLTRLELYNKYADARARDKGWLLFDMWNLTLPFLLAPRRDIAHPHDSMRLHQSSVFVNLICRGPDDHLP